MKKKMKHLIAVTMCLVLSISVLSGCGSSSESTGSKEKADSLNIMVWEGTWSEEMFQDFTKETGIKVNISYIDNTDTLLAKMIEGSADYDLIDLEGAYVKSFLDGEKYSGEFFERGTNWRYRRKIYDSKYGMQLYNDCL